jgi:DNA-binding transcriptional ArsR family regulator
LQGANYNIQISIVCILVPLKISQRQVLEAISVQDIVEKVGTSQSNISQHLAILREKDILNFKKDANRVFYYIDDPRVLN